MSSTKRDISITDNSMNYLETHVTNKRDRQYAINVLKLFNLLTTRSNCASIPFSVSGHNRADLSTFSICFYTTFDLSYDALSTLVDDAQVKQVTFVPCNKRLSVKGHAQFLLHRDKDIEAAAQHKQKTKFRRLHDEGTSVHEYSSDDDKDSGDNEQHYVQSPPTQYILRSVNLDEKPVLGNWASRTDREIARRILEHTYAMHDTMPCVKVQIEPCASRGKYRIHCINVPAIDSGYLNALMKQFLTYIVDISLSVHTASITYILRLHKHPIDLVISKPQSISLHSMLSVSSPGDHGRRGATKRKTLDRMSQAVTPTSTYTQEEKEGLKEYPFSISVPAPRLTIQSPAQKRCRVKL